MLEHGGRLRLAAQQYGIAIDEWLDLSTGINPQNYPIPAIDPLYWQRLPEENDGLEQAAANYYGNSRLLVLPGSQAAIQTLPVLFKTAVVACVAPVYEEHPHAWAKAGHKLRRLPSLQRALAAMTPYVQLCSPNNPTGQHYQRDQLLDAAAQLHRRGGWLIVDEAFADADPDENIVQFAGTETAPNLIVLRSLGKFFGLAGARVGFVFGAEEKLNALREMLGPWPVANPCRFVAKVALEDSAWQSEARQQLHADAKRLASVLQPLGQIATTPLFCTVSGGNAELPVEALVAHFSKRAILVRSFEEHGRIRFGLPYGESAWQRLQEAVSAWTSA